MTSETTIGATFSELNLAVDAFDHPEWQRAQAIQITRKWSGEDAPPARYAEAKIIWNDAALLVRFVCRQEEPLIVNSRPQLEKKTLGLWDRDVCEIFIAPDPKTPERYFEFEAAPTGEWVDLAINFTTSGRQTDFEFNSGMTAAAINIPGQSNITMRIPWSESLPKPQRGERWRANLFRCVGPGNDRYHAWQPTRTPEPNFHVPEVFGWIEFC